MPLRIRYLAVLICVVLAGCVSIPSASVPDISRSNDKTILLLGEVHDNPTGHQQRYEMLKRSIAAGWRPAIAMEQFDLGQQAELDRAMTSCTAAPCVIRMASPDKSSWQWRFYEPVIDLALAYKLPILAANVSRKDAAKIMRAGYGAVFDDTALHAAGLDQPIPADIAEAQMREVTTGHCGKLPATMLPMMMRAQVARDAGMASVLRAHAEGIVLLAGNGHVRRDIGVSRWLHGIDTQKVFSIGFIEGEAAAGMFDIAISVPPATREDPCASL